MVTAPNPRQTVWLLTSERDEYSEYSRLGEYFVAVFSQKPTAQQLVDNNVPEHAVAHVIQGGGRKAAEYEWWHLREESLQ